MENYLPLIIAAAVLIIAVIAVLIVIHKVKRAARRWSNTLFGTNSLREGFAQQQERLSETPKSVSGMTKLCLPQIQRDFPEFHYEEFRQRAENTLKSILTAVSEQDTALLREPSDELKNQVMLKIEDDKRQGVQEHFTDITIHQTEIARYRKEAGRCIVVLQSAVGYFHYVTGANGLASGSKELKEQTKYNLELHYVQDISKAASASQDKAIGLTCPNCGAPVTTLGSKHCAYCGGAVTELNIYAWQFNRYEEV